MSMECPKKIANRMSATKAWRDLVGEPGDSTSPIRWDLVNRIRAEIAAGTYDTPEKFAAAIDRMSHSLLV